MPDTRQLSMLADIAQEKRDAAARKLAQALTLLADSESRLSLLDKYCADYRTRLALAAAQGVSVDEMRNFREFIVKLEQAITQQRTEVETLRRGVADCRDRWMLARRKGRSLDVLAERAFSVAREIESRRLQKLVDEFASRNATLRATG